MSTDSQKEPEKGILDFVDKEKDPKHYIIRYLKEPNYKEWFEKNYPDYTIYEAVGMPKEEFLSVKSVLTKESEVKEPEKGGFFKSKFSGFGSKIKKHDEQKETQKISDQTTRIQAESKELKSTEDKPELSKPLVESLLDRVSDYEATQSRSFEDFVDEQLLVSRDAMGRKEMKIKVLEVSDENPPLQWKLGDRVKVNKILITIKHLETQQVEEGELDIEKVEKELAEKRHYTSTNRWVPTNDIKNGYVIGGRHISLISDAVALEYITF